MRVEIINWKDLVGQFGLQDTKEGLLSARQLSRELTKKVNNQALGLPKIDETFNHMFIPCNTKSEADAYFQLVRQEPTELHYEYIGTQN